MESLKRALGRWRGYAGDPLPGAVAPSNAARALAELAAQDGGFKRHKEAVERANVKTWLTDNERALLYGIARFGQGVRTIVEIGSYCGGSASFLAGGLAARPSKGKVYCVDPMLGAPVWFGTHPDLATLEAFQRNVSALGLDAYIDLRVGTSSAVAAIWPARPIDVLLIDGDHSFLGTFRDFEAWAPKVRPGGIVIIDDLRSFPSLSLFMRIMEACESIEVIEEYDELSIFHLRHAGDDLIEDLREAARRHSILRPWDYGIVHATPVAAAFEKTRGWRDPALHTAYFLSYLNVAGDGAYGVTDGCDEELAVAISGAQRDRGAGDFVRIAEEGRTTRGFRVIGCDLAEAPEMVARLKPGAVLLMRLPADGEPELDDIRTNLEDLGLDGVGWTGTEQVLVWGVGKIDALSDEIVLGRHIGNRN